DGGGASVSAPRIGGRRSVMGGDFRTDGSPACEPGLLFTPQSGCGSVCVCVCVCVSVSDRARQESVPLGGLLHLTLVVKREREREREKEKKKESERANTCWISIYVLI